MDVSVSRASSYPSVPISFPRETDYEILLRELARHASPRHDPPTTTPGIARSDDQSSFTPRLEGLEERTVLSAVALTVENTADSGPGSLREAVDMPTTIGHDMIQFAKGVSRHDPVNQRRTGDHRRSDH